jgi:hypothetical protein
MSLSDWFRRTFSSSPSAEAAEDEAIKQKEYGDAVPAEPPSDARAGGPTGVGFQTFGSAEAAEDAIHATDPPPDPAE